MLTARALLIPPPTLWRDLVAILCVYWMFSALVTSRRAWVLGTAAFVSLLLGIYAWGAAPHVLSTFGMGS